MMRKLRRKVGLVRWRVRQHWERVCIAARYAAGCSTEPDGWVLFHDGERLTGFYCLEGFSEGDVLSQIQDRFGEFAEAPALCRAATRRVSDKWNSSGDTANAAQDWAADLVEEYAKQDGVALVDSWSVDAEVPGDE